MVETTVVPENDDAGVLAIKIVSHFVRNDFKEGVTSFIDSVFRLGYFPAVGIMIPSRLQGFDFNFFYRTTAGTIGKVEYHTNKEDVTPVDFPQIFQERSIDRICSEHNIVSYLAQVISRTKQGYVIGFSSDLSISQRKVNILHIFSLVVLFGLLNKIDDDIFLIPSESKGIPTPDDLLLVPGKEKLKAVAGIVSRSNAFNKVLEKVELVAPTDATVLITGESGTGKELIARAVQQWSRRNDKPWIKLNCAALPSSLIESELFGHEKGAFTGAIGQKKGRFEMAHQGTIFLDEIGELPLDLQTKLLRVLQEGEFERIGGTKTVEVDVRIIAATNRDLDDLIEKKLFRGDLFYRLNVFPIHTPPLRERLEDVPFLVDHFIKKYNTKFNKHVNSVSTSATEALELYHWPGNVRELENVIERALISSFSSVLNLTEWVDAHVQSRPLKLEKKTLQQVEIEYIRSVLVATNWRIRGETGAAAALGIKPTTLEAKIKKLGIKRDAI